MTIQTQAFTPPEFQPLKICTYKPTMIFSTKAASFLSSIKTQTYDKKERDYYLSLIYHAFHLCLYE